MKELEQIFKHIKNREFLPIYFFHGEEAFFIDAAVKALENDVLTEDEKAFNQTVVYGKDTNYNDILALSRQYPMMGDKQLIIVKEAQDLKLNEDESRILENYATNPVESTILVFAHKHKKVDSRKKVFKVLDKANMLFHSEPVKDYNLAKWIEDEAKNLQIKLVQPCLHKEQAADPNMYRFPLYHHRYVFQSIRQGGHRGNLSLFRFREAPQRVSCTVPAPV